MGVPAGCDCSAGTGTVFSSVGSRGCAGATYLGGAGAGGAIDEGAVAGIQIDVGDGLVVEVEGAVVEGDEPAGQLQGHVVAAADDDGAGFEGVVPGGARLGLLDVDDEGSLRHSGG